MLQMIQVVKLDSTDENFASNIDHARQIPGMYMQELNGDYIIVTCGAQIPEQFQILALDIMADAVMLSGRFMSEFTLPVSRLADIYFETARAFNTNNVTFLRKQYVKAYSEVGRYHCKIGEISNDSISDLEAMKVDFMMYSDPRIGPTIFLDDPKDFNKIKLYLPITYLHVIVNPDAFTS